jgi:hypothetical protein
MSTPYTGRTHQLDGARFPEVFPESYEVERQPDRVVYVQAPASGMHPMTLACIIGAMLLLVYLARSGAYSAAQHPDPAWTAPAPAQPNITITDNSWNWNACVVCTDGNASPHFDVGQP